MVTPKQKRILDAVRALWTHPGGAPSLRDVAREAGLRSPATVHRHVAHLIAEGLLVKEGGRIAPAPPPVSTGVVAIPLIGTVPAGHPLEVFEYLGPEIDVPDWLVPRRSGMAALKVRGDSMRDAYIGDGDIVVIEMTPRADSGDMVVAALDDNEITLKRLRIEDGAYWLVPENPEFQPMKRDELRIIGKVKAVLRQYA